MTPLTKFIGILLLVFFIGFFSAMIIIPIIQHKKAMKELNKNNANNENKE